VDQGGPEHRREARGGAELGGSLKEGRVDGGREGGGEINP